MRSKSGHDSGRPRRRRDSQCFRIRRTPRRKFFLVKDALSLDDWDERFASVIDFGLFHGFSDDDRRLYVRGLARVIEPGGRLFLAYLSDEEPGEVRPRRVSRPEQYDAFADGWDVESVQPCLFELDPEFTEVTFSPGGPRMWFAVVRRQG